MKNTVHQKMYYTLRVASAMCFIGHGSFGIITKPIWCNYFGVFGIQQQSAYTLMPWLGAVDIIMGLIILFYPIRAAIAWLVVWGMLTAMLRPLSGEPFAEFIERAGNYGAPLCLLLLTDGIGNKIRHWLMPVKLNTDVSNAVLNKVMVSLRIVVFLLFAGHGWLNLLEKKSLLDQYARLGFSNEVQVAQVTGLLEILAAVAVLVRPSKSLLLLLFVWKAASELVYPHYEIFEWIERGGSYGCVLALYFMMGKKTMSVHKGRFAAGSKKYNALAKNTSSVFNIN